MNYREASLKKHADWKGKIETVCRVPVDSREALSLAYTPGVAEPCMAIHDDGLYNFFRILCTKANGVRVHVAVRLEQRALAFHNGHTRFRTYIAHTVRQKGYYLPGLGMAEPRAERDCGNN